MSWPVSQSAIAARGPWARVPKRTTDEARAEAPTVAPGQKVTRTVSPSRCRGGVPESRRAPEDTGGEEDRRRGQHGNDGGARSGQSVASREAGEADCVIRVRQRQVPVVAVNTDKEVQRAAVRQRCGVSLQVETVLCQKCVGPPGKAAAAPRLREERCSHLAGLAGPQTAPREWRFLRREAGGTLRRSGEQLAREKAGRIVDVACIRAGVFPRRACQQDREVIEVLRGSRRGAAVSETGSNEVQPLRCSFGGRWRRRVRVLPSVLLSVHTDAEQ